MPHTKSLKDIFRRTNFFLRVGGKRHPDGVANTTLEQAAIIAAYNSKARESTRVAVDYTIIKNVKKPNGAKPGMVIYDNYETAIVTPDEQLVNSLRAL